MIKINDKFTRDWENGGEVPVIDTEHFSFAIDKDYISFSLSLSIRYRLLYVAFLWFVIRVY